MFSNQVWKSVLQLVALIVGAVFASLSMFGVDIISALVRLKDRPFDALILLVNIIVAIVFIFTLVSRLSNTASSLGYSAADSPQNLLVDQVESYAMYRSNQQEIRYFQNEITLIDSFAAALIGAIRTPAPPSLKLVLTALSKNERNRLMKKGEKTIVSSDETEFIRALSTLSKLKEALGASEVHS
jgi:hypothetical protein